MRDFTAEPHTAIVGEPAGRDHEPGGRARRSRRRTRCWRSRASDPTRRSPKSRRLVMPGHHDVRAEDVDLKRLGAVLARRLRARVARFRVVAAAREARAAHAAVAGAGRRGGARRADALRRSGALLVRARRQGRPSVPGAAEDLRRVDRRAAALARRAKLEGSDKKNGFARLDRFVRVVEQRAQPEADLDAVMRTSARSAVPWRTDGVRRSSAAAEGKRKDEQMSLFPADVSAEWPA